MKSVEPIKYCFVRIEHEKQLTLLLRLNWIQENALFAQALINALKPVFTLPAHTHIRKLILNSHKKHSNTNKYNKCQLSRLIDPFSLNCVCKFRSFSTNVYSVTLAHYSTRHNVFTYTVVHKFVLSRAMHACVSRKLWIKM